MPRDIPEHERGAKLVGLPLKRSFLMRAQKLPIASGRRWHAVPDDVETDFLHGAMQELALAFDLFDPQDAAYPMIDPHCGPVEPGIGMAEPMSLVQANQEEIFPHASNGRLQRMVHDQKQAVLHAMKKEGLSEHEIPSNVDEAHAWARPGLILPKWMLDAKKVDAVEKSIRMHAYNGLPELKRLHESEATIAGTNTEVFMETGWHPQNDPRPAPRSVRESSEMQRLVDEQKKAQETLEYVDPEHLVDQFLIPQAARDMQMWENPSLTLPWASPMGFFDSDSRRGLDPEEVDNIHEGVDSWLATGVSTGCRWTGAGAQALEELLWRMQNRDGMRPGMMKNNPSSLYWLRSGQSAPKGYGKGFIFEPALVTSR